MCTHIYRFPEVFENPLVIGKKDFKPSLAHLQKRAFWKNEYS